MNHKLTSIIDSRISGLGGRARTDSGREGVVKENKKCFLIYCFVM